MREDLLEHKLRFLTLILILLALFGCKNTTQEKKLNIINWANYIGKSTIADFEKETGIKVTYDNFSSNEELFAKLKAGATGYDLIVPSDYMVEIMRKEDMLIPLDRKKLPHFTNLDEQFLDHSFDPQNKYCIPYHWGSVALGINTKYVKNIKPTWDMIWDESYKGKISTLDDPRAGFIPALKKMGVSLNTTNQEEIKKAGELLTKQKPLVHSYTSDMYIDLLVSEEIWIAAGYTGDILQAKKDNPSITLVLPVEGSEIAIDHFCIPKGAQNLSEAHQFLDYLMRADVAASIANDIRYATCNKTAKKGIEAELLEDHSIYPLEDQMKKLEFMSDVGDAQSFYDKTWAEVKAG